MTSFTFSFCLFFFFFNESRRLNSHFPLRWSHKDSRVFQGRALVCLSRDTCGIQTGCILHSWCGTLVCADLACWLRSCSRGVRSLWGWRNILNLYLQSQTNSRKNTQNWAGDHSFSQLVWWFTVPGLELWSHRGLFCHAPCPHHRKSCWLYHSYMSRSG